MRGGPGVMTLAQPGLRRVGMTVVPTSLTCCPKRCGKVVKSEEPQWDPRVGKSSGTRGPFLRATVNIPAVR